MSFSHLYRAFVFGAAVCIVVGGLRAASTVLVPVLVALFLSGIVLAPYLWLRKRGVGRWLALTAVLVTAAGMVTAVTFMGIHWSHVLSERWPAYLNRIEHFAVVAGDGLARFGFEFTTDSAREAIDTTMIRNVSGSMLRVVGNLAAVLVLTGFVFADLVGLPVKLGPGLKTRPGLQGMARQTLTRLLTYFRIKTATSAATGVLAGVACASVGLELASLWGFVAFALNYITTVGSLVAAAPPLILAAATLGLTRFLILGVAYLVINIVVGAILEPKLLGDSMGLSPVTVLLSLAFWGWVLGPMGVLLAVPLTMVLKLIFNQTEELRVVAVLMGSQREGRTAWRQDGPRITVEQATATLEHAVRVER